MNKCNLIRIIPCLLLAVILSSCFIDSSTGDIDIPRPPNMKEDSIPPDITTPDDAIEKARLANVDDANTKVLTYESCAVYAASNEYAFKDKDGKMTLVMVSQLPETKKEKQVKVPDNMLESSAEIEGPPGANPDMVGKEFLLIYDDNDEVIEIRLKE